GRRLGSSQGERRLDSRDGPLQRSTATAPAVNRTLTCVLYMTTCHYFGLTTWRVVATLPRGQNHSPSSSGGSTPTKIGMVACSTRRESGSPWHGYWVSTSTTTD